MRELEFIPTWYPQLRVRRRLVLLQAWLVGSAIVGLGVVLLALAHNVHAKQLTLNLRSSQVIQSNAELEKLTHLQILKKQMSEQVHLLNRLGPEIPSARMLDAMKQIMPDSMALLDLSLVVQEHARPLSPLATAGDDPVVDRSLEVQLPGVAPSDVEIGNFMIKLATIPNSAVSSSFVQDMHQNGHLMREFKITFTIAISSPQP